MKLPSPKTVLLTPIIAFLVFYAIGAMFVMTRDEVQLTSVPTPSNPLEVAIFGASGTAGDGILKAALASADIQKIHIMKMGDRPRFLKG